LHIPESVIRFDSLDPLRGARSFRFGRMRRVVRADALTRFLRFGLVIQPDQHYRS